mgnify:CR=1 FL=1
MIRFRFSCNYTLQHGRAGAKYRPDGMRVRVSLRAAIRHVYWPGCRQKMCPPRIRHILGTPFRSICQVFRRVDESVHSITFSFDHDFYCPVDQPVHGRAAGLHCSPNSAAAGYVGIHHTNFLSDTPGTSQVTAMSSEFSITSTVGASSLSNSPSISASPRAKMVGQ